MDKTPVWLEMPGRSTYATKGDSEVRVSSTGHKKKTIELPWGPTQMGLLK